MTLNRIIPPSLRPGRHLGYYASSEAAAGAYDRAAISLQGWGALTNEPPECFRGDPVLSRLLGSITMRAAASAGSLLPKRANLLDFVERLKFEMHPCAEAPPPSGKVADAAPRALPPPRARPASAPAVAATPVAAAAAPRRFRGASQMANGRWSAQIWHDASIRCVFRLPRFTTLVCSPRGSVLMLHELRITTFPPRPCTFPSSAVLLGRFKPPWLCSDGWALSIVERSYRPYSQAFSFF